MGSFYLYPNKCLPGARENFLGHRHEEQGGACGWQTGGGGVVLAERDVTSRAGPVEEMRLQEQALRACEVALGSFAPSG